MRTVVDSALLITLTFILITFTSSQTQLPSFVKKCKLSSPSEVLDQCLTENAQTVMDHIENGIPEFEIPPFKPPELKDINYGISNVLKFHFVNMRLEIPKTTKINYTKLDQKKKKITYSFTNSGYLYSDYGARGRLFLIPINVNGNCEIKLINMNYVYKLYYEPTKGKNGKEYWKIVKNRVNYEAERMEFKFTNLINEQISKSISEFTNENWKEIFAEVGGPIMQSTVAGAISDASKIFDLFAADELFDP